LNVCGRRLKLIETGDEADMFIYGSAVYAKTASGLWLPISKANPMAVRLSDGVDEVEVESDGSLPAILKGGSTLTHSAFAVTTSSQEVLASNTDRKYALFINDSDTTIYLKVGADAAVGEGIRLNANGGSYEMSAGLGNLDTRAVYAIHGGAETKNLLIVEGE